MKRLSQALRKKDPLERAKSICDSLDIEESVEYALIPAEANNQIPELFLSCKILPECEIYYAHNAVKLSEKEEEKWNAQIEDILEGMSIQMNIETFEEKRKCFTEQELIEKIKCVLG
ncbi:hypothetical protein NEFER03_1895 [Nematocida sp. LUAm3]|nr:hypothetical protein NEFER03_1895 [Nematocida sp. LUAm3]KAI5173954.1 hypothetical protein NEFER02_0421 [Nematocida sp. LUAm2]KAI5177301.1 hypothetical protein NEFER01_0576 [Nematocida sp. LUAm1]